MIIQRKVRFGRGGRGWKKASAETETTERRTARVPRVARLMALAIRFDQLIRDGVVAGQAELARVGHVSRARLTQIMTLLNLAPEIQEELLFLMAPSCGRQLLTETQLRSIARALCWNSQRRLWQIEAADPDRKCFGKPGRSSLELD